MIRFGPAGWSYPDWEGIVYPKPKPRGFDPLAYVAEFFDTVEVNSSFYGPPKADVAASWAARVKHRPDFRFTAKLWRRFTHERASTWTRAEAAETRAGFEPLMKEGCWARC